MRMRRTLSAMSSAGCAYVVGGAVAGAGMRSGMPGSADDMFTLQLVSSVLGCSETGCLVLWVFILPDLTFRLLRRKRGCCC